MLAERSSLPASVCPVVATLRPLSGCRCDHWRSAVSAPFKPVRQVAKVRFQSGFVRDPCFPVYSLDCFAVEAVEGVPQSIHAVDMVPQGRQLRTRSLPGRLPYARQRLVQTFPTQCPEPALLARIPLGQPPSLHPLRRTSRSSPFVRRLPRYYGAVRLPASVHHSRIRPETDSNYTSLLSIWDRLFKSFS